MDCSMCISSFFFPCEMASTTSYSNRFRYNYSCSFVAPLYYHSFMNELEGWNHISSDFTLESEDFLDSQKVEEGSLRE